MKRKRNRRYMKTLLSLLLALLLALQGTEPIFVQAKETIEEMPRSVDFSRPEPLTETEAGIEESDVAEETENGEQNESSDQPSQVAEEQANDEKTSGSGEDKASEAAKPEGENTEVQTQIKHSSDRLLTHCFLKKKKRVSKVAREICSNYNYKY